jgi:3-deoxy-7-phosphoheptulonate synthase
MTDPARLVYGRSVTDPCLGWDRTVETLREARALLSGIVEERRQACAHPSAQRVAAT